MPQPISALQAWTFTNLANIGQNTYNVITGQSILKDSSYQSNPNVLNPPAGWSIGQEQYDPQSNYYAVSFVNSTTQQVVIAYGETQGPTDTASIIQTDQPIAQGQRPNEFDEAQRFATNVQGDSAYAGYSFFTQESGSELNFRG